MVYGLMGSRDGELVRGKGWCALRCVLAILFWFFRGGGVLDAEWSGALWVVDVST